MFEFNTIPANTRVPGNYIEISNRQAQQGTLPMPHRVLMFGQMLASGSAVAGEPVLVTQAGQAGGLFGQGSMLQHMVAMHFATAAAAVPLWVLPLEDAGAGTKATRDVTVDTAPTAAGTLNLYIGGRRVRVAVAAGDAVADVATAIADAVNADTNGYVTAAAALGVVTLTARHAGVDAGVIDVRHSYYQGESLPDGVTLTIADPVAGTGNPDMTAALDALGDEWYQTIVMPWTDDANLTALEAELADRFGGVRMIEGHAFTAYHGTVAELTTFADGRNSPHLTAADAGQVIVPPWLLAAADAGIDAAEPDPARQRRTLALPAEILPVPETARRIWSERGTLLDAGIATHVVDANGRVAVERLVTTYQENAQGVPDESYLDVTTLRTVAYMRWSGRVMMITKYPRHKLAKNGSPIPAGAAIVTPDALRGEWVALYLDWVDIGIADGSPEAVGQFKRDLVLEIDDGDPNRINAIIPPDLINNLRVFAAAIEFRQ